MYRITAITSFSDNYPYVMMNDKILYVTDIFY